LYNSNQMYAYAMQLEYIHQYLTCTPLCDKDCQ
jgi:hypothetical protein